jgi:putative GTP pyrophosphokinase
MLLAEPELSVERRCSGTLSARRMAFPTPQFTKGEINRAGEILASEISNPGDLEWAKTVLGNWRGCHGYPINTFQATLRGKLSSVEQEGLVAQRLKRTVSIVEKLRRFDSMRLARMQDIGGLRAVVSSVAKVRELRETYRSTRFKHELVSEKDYIAVPKTDGYRSVHLVFRYCNDRAPEYNGLSLELQIRTKLQHAWATAVETMGTFLGQALKSRQGESTWLKFFEITGSAFAYLERSPLVPGYEHLTRQETYARVAEAERELGVLQKLRGFSIAVDAITKVKGRGNYHLIVLDSANKTVTVHPYATDKLEQAMKDYSQVESRVTAGESIEAVLVSAGPVESLRRAYPNYFLDTNEFVRRVEWITKNSASKE